MARYADLVEQSLGTMSNAPSLVSVSRIDLAFPYELPRWTPASISTWLNHFWIRVFARKRIEASEADLVHLLDGSYGYVLRNLSHRSTVATVHDLIPFIQQNNKFGQQSGSMLAKKIIHDSFVGLNNCIHLLADSTNTANDLTDLKGFAKERITVVPIALDPSLEAHQSSNDDDPINENERELTYIFHVGNNGFYKNREGVIRIYSEVLKRLDIRLKMAGPPPTDSLRNLVRQLSLEKNVEFVISPSDAELVKLYQHASLFLFPSIYEGFGWPPLEAMACNCPVVCSSEGALPEVVGDAALTAPADSESELANLCITLLEDPELAVDLARRGRARSRLFSVQRMRDDLIQAYLKALSNPGLVPDSIQ